MFSKFCQSVVLCLLSFQGISQDFSSFQYRTVGPERGGRVTAVSGTAMLPSTFYLGASGGGVWKTDDYGTTWYNVSDGYFETPSIGAISVAVNDPNIVYVGTGSDGLRSNVISGKGVYKSIDGGCTWKHIGLKNVGQIGAVEIDPRDHNIVWVAAIGNAFRANKERGVYKTVNGGETWEKVLFISDQVGCADLELLPGNPNIVYATAWKAERKPWTIISGGDNKEGGIYKSINGGKTWKKLGSGLPQGLIGKIDLAVSPANSSLVYAVIEAPGKQGGLYKSVNQGASFTQVSDHRGLVNRPFYYINLEVDPKNPDIVYSMAGSMYKSIDGGKSWTKMTVPHVDSHDMWINPNNTDLYIQSNDGGANITHNGGMTWSTQFNQPTAELYQVEVDDQYPYWLYAGMQDNYTTIAIPSFPPSATQTPGNGWIINTGGCETGPAVPKPGNHNIVYANCKGKFSVFNKETGTEKSYYVGASNIYGHNPKDLKYRFQRVTPVHVSPHNPDVVYHGSQYLHKTRNGGLEWETISPDLTAFEADKQVISGSPITRDITGEEYYSTLYSVRESKLVEGLIWTGSNDGVVSITKDGGKSWENITPSNLPKGGRVESIEPSHYDPAKAYIAVDRHLLGDDTPYLYKTENYGKSWSLISTKNNGIPSDFISRVLREDPIKEGLLYAGTEGGMFISLDDGMTWKRFQQNLPVTPVTDIKIVRGDLVLSTMGRGFWILDDITSLRQSAITDLNMTPHLFKPNTTIRYRYPKVRKGFMPKYPETSVTFDYFIPKSHTGGVQLDIYDENDYHIASISGDSSRVVENVFVEQNMNLSQVFRYVDNTLDSRPGLHRFHWNMKEKGAWHMDSKKRYKNGPLVAPGKYNAVLTVNDLTYEKPFEIRIDPRVEASGVSTKDIREQILFQRKVITLLDKARKLQGDIEKKIGALRTKTLAKNTTKISKLESQLKKLKNDSGAYPQQMLVAQISYLLNMVSRADQLPGKDAKDRYVDLVSQLDIIKRDTPL